MFGCRVKKVFLIAVFAMFFAPGAAVAQDVGVSIGVVDVQAVLQKSKAGQDIQAQLERKRNEYQNQISSKETALRQAERALVDQKDKLSEADFMEKRKEFEQDVIAAQKLVQNNKRSLDAGFGRALSKLRDEIRQIIASVANQRDLSVVLSQESVLLAEHSLDMTDDVIAALDRELSKIPIDWTTPTQ